MELRGKSYRAIMQIKGLSREITNISVAETVHCGAGRSLIFDKGKNIRDRRGLRP